MGGRCRALGEERSPPALSQDPSPRLGLGSSCVTTTPPPSHSRLPSNQPTWTMWVELGRLERWVN